MTELALFGSAFATVFLLVFQQQNVIHRRHGLGTATSLLIGLAQYSFFANGNEIFEAIIKQYGLEKRRRKS